ncbi:cell division [Paramecium bursaria]
MLIERYFGKEVNLNVTSSRDYGVIKKTSLLRSISQDDKMTIEEDPNPQVVSQYQSDIFSYLVLQENQYTIEPYMTSERQPDINIKMRAILVDWLVDVHLKFKLKDETLYMTVQLIDRYLSKVQTSRLKLQLVGVASLFIACKYEEIYPPALKDFVYITDNAYVKQDVLEMESQILQALEFNITQPSQYTFLEKYSQNQLDTKNKYLAQYILELALVDYRFSFYKPSQLAASAIYLVNKIRKQTPSFSNEMELRPLAKDLCQMIQAADLNQLQAVKKKFAHIKYLEVSRIRIEKCQKSQ